MLDIIVAAAVEVSRADGFLIATPPTPLLQIRNQIGRVLIFVMPILPTLNKKKLHGDSTAG
jgi:hypothetical protein